MKIVRGQIVKARLKKLSQEKILNRKFICQMINCVQNVHLNEIVNVKPDLDLPGCLMVLPAKISALLLNPQL